MAEVVDVRTRKIDEGKVEAIAMLDEEGAEGVPVTVKGYGATPDEAIADARAKAAARQP